MTPRSETAWRSEEALFVTSDGTRIAVSDTGSRITGTDRPPSATVIFLHGWSQNRAAWDDVAGPLHEQRPELRLVAFDQRGHGKSDPAPAGTAGATGQARDVGEFIDSNIPAGPIVFVGHSMGGITMMRLPELRPDLMAQRISGAVFVATACGDFTRRGPALSPRFQGLLKKLIVHLPAQEWLLQRSFLVKPVLSALVFGRNPRPYDVDRVAAQVRSGHVRSYMDAIANVVEDLFALDMRDGLKCYRGMPVAVLAGSRDLLTPASESRAIAAALATDNLHVYPGSGHMLPNERAGEVIGEIISVTDMAVRRQAGPAADVAN